MHLQDRQALFGFGQWHHDLAIEATWAQQGRIENVGAVGGGKDDDAFAGLETVHLREHLVQGLLTLVVTAAKTCAALAAD